ncbi:hypothetical protein FN846DRAFT_955370 [Sphaerosporella brunnea]|uniref:Uncharacterized protein n=1 Tax=Sphaerosporella brunnea TaxID=1250544 RepID=A0A5J5ESV8_9PEZI|nr:hypothetical protein FN846DRAFT_955370 [Sphaerosporella brunnea]
MTTYNNITITNKLDCSTIFNDHVSIPLYEKNQPNRRCPQNTKLSQMFLHTITILSLAILSLAAPIQSTTTTTSTAVTVPMTLLESLLVNIPPPAGGQSYGDAKCDTTPNSPTYDEIYKAAWKAYMLGLCKQTNPAGSKCKQVANHNGGEVSICGAYGQAVDCKAVAWAALSVLSKCGKSNIGRASGWIQLNNSLKTVVW